MPENDLARAMRLMQRKTGVSSGTNYLAQYEAKREAGRRKALPQTSAAKARRAGIAPGQAINAARARVYQTPEYAHAQAALDAAESSGSADATTLEALTEARAQAFEAGQRRVLTENPELLGAVASEVEANREAYRKHENTKRWVDVLDDIERNPARLVPFLSPANEASDLLRIHTIARRVEEGEASVDDLRELEGWLRESQRTPTFAAKVADIVADLPAFAGEFLLTGPLTVGGRAVAGRVGLQALRKKVEGAIASNARKSFLRRGALRATQGSLRGLEVATGEATRLPAFYSRAQAHALQQSIPQMRVGNDDNEGMEIVLDGPVTADWTENLPAGFVDTYVELLTERSGRLLEHVPGSSMVRGMKAAVARRWMHRTGGTINDLARRLGRGARVTGRAAGWNGVVGEIFEERVGELARGGLYEVSDGEFGAKYEVPTLDQLAAEAVAFTLVPFGANAVSEGAGLVDRISRRGTPGGTPGGAPVGTPPTATPPGGVPGGQPQDVPGGQVPDVPGGQGAIEPQALTPEQAAGVPVPDNTLADGVPVFRDQQRAEALAAFRNERLAEGEPRQVAVPLFRAAASSPWVVVPEQQEAPDGREVQAGEVQPAQEPPAEGQGDVPGEGTELASLSGDESGMAFRAGRESDIGLPSRDAIERAVGRPLDDDAVSRWEREFVRGRSERVRAVSREAQSVPEKAPIVPPEAPIVSQSQGSASPEPQPQQPVEAAQQPEAPAEASAPAYRDYMTGPGGGPYKTQELLRLSEQERTSIIDSALGDIRERARAIRGTKPGNITATQWEARARRGARATELAQLEKNARDWEALRPKPTPAPDTREPWQMTRGEYAGASIQTSGAPGVMSHGSALPGAIPVQDAELLLSLPRDIGSVSPEDTTNLRRLKNAGLVHRTEQRQGSRITVSWERTEAGENAASLQAPSEDKSLRRYQEHRALVERALAEGREVPPAVLADYPDLAPKAAPKPEPAKPAPKPTAKPSDDEAPLPSKAVQHSLDQILDTRDWMVQGHPGKSKMENGMATIRLHAGKLGIELEPLRTFFDAEQYRRIADQASMEVAKRYGGFPTEKRRNARDAVRANDARLAKSEELLKLSRDSLLALAKSEGVAIPTPSHKAALVKAIEAKRETPGKGPAVKPTIRGYTDELKRYMKGRASIGRIDADAKREWLKEFGIPSDDTGRKLRYVYELSDGRKVSTESALKFTNPEAFDRLKKRHANLSTAAARVEMFEALPSAVQKSIVDELPIGEMALAGGDVYGAINAYLNENGHILADIWGQMEGVRRVLINRIGHVQEAEKSKHTDRVAAARAWRLANKSDAAIVTLQKDGRFVSTLLDSDKHRDLIAYGGWVDVDDHPQQSPDATAPEATREEDRPAPAQGGVERATAAAMRQYEAFKQKHPDAILLMRIGDFYEAFGDDAQTLHDVLGLTLSQRGDTKLAGVPYHQVEQYLRKLVAAGKRVAIAEAVNPRTPHDREITRTVTPSTESTDEAQEPAGAESIQAGTTDASDLDDEQTQFLDKLRDIIKQHAKDPSSIVNKINAEVATRTDSKARGAKAAWAAWNHPSAYAIRAQYVAARRARLVEHDLAKFPADELNGLTGLWLPEGASAAAIIKKMEQADRASLNELKALKERGGYNPIQANESAGDYRPKPKGFPSPSSPSTSRIAPRAKNRAEMVKRLVDATAMENSRYATKGVQVTGDEMAVTDGRRLHVARQEGGWGIENGLYLPTKTGELEAFPDADAKFPPYDEILYSSPKAAWKDRYRTGGVNGYQLPDITDLPRFVSMVRRAAVMTNEESRGVTLFLNSNTPDDYGVFARGPDIGEAAVGIKHNGIAVLGLNPDFLIDAMNLMASVGAERVSVFWGGAHKPMQFASDNGLAAAIVMPVGLGSDNNRPVDDGVKAMLKGSPEAAAQEPPKRGKGAKGNPREAQRSLTDRIEEWADNVIEGVRARRRGTRLPGSNLPGMRSGATNLPQMLIDAVYYATAQILRGAAKGYRAIKADLIREFGAEMGQHAEQVFKDAVTAARKIEAAEEPTIEQAVEARLTPANAAKSKKQPAAPKPGPTRETKIIASAFRQGRDRALAQLGGMIAEARKAGKQSEQVRQKVVEGLRAELARLVADHLPMSWRGKFLPDIQRIRTLGNLAASINKLRRELARWKGSEYAKRIKALGAWKRLRRLSAVEQVAPGQSFRSSAQTLIREADQIAQRLRNRVGKDRPAGYGTDALEADAARLEAIYRTLAEYHAIFALERKLIASRRGDTLEALTTRIADEVVASDKVQATKTDPKERLDPRTRLGSRYANMLADVQTLTGDLSRTLEAVLYADQVAVEENYLRQRRDRMEALGEIARDTDFRDLDDLRDRTSRRGGTGRTDFRTVTLGGQQVRITLGNALKIYAYLGDADTVAQIRKGRPLLLEGGRKQAPVEATIEELEAVAASLSADERSIVDRAKAIREADVPALARVVRRMKGYEPRWHEGYEPRSVERSIREAPGTFESLFASGGTRWLENLGFLKERTGGGEAIVVGDFITDAIEAFDNTAKVIHLAPTIRDAYAILTDRKVSEAITAKRGRDHYGLLKEYLVAASRSNELIRSLWGRFIYHLNRVAATAKLGLNPRSWLRQLGSIPRMRASMSQAAWNAGLAGMWDVSYDTLFQSGYLYDRYHQHAEGRFSSQTESTSTRRRMGRDLERAFLNLVKRREFGAAFRALQDAAAAPLQILNWWDAITARFAWAAADHEASQKKLDGKAKLEYTIERANQLVRENNNASSVLDMPMLGIAGKDSAVALFTLFTSDAMKVRNRIVRAKRRGKAELSRHLAAESLNIAWGLGITVAVGAAIAGAVGMLGGDDDDAARLIDKAVQPSYLVERAFRDAVQIIDPVFAPRAIEWWSQRNRPGADLLNAPLPSMAADASDALSRAIRMVENENEDDLAAAADALVRDVSALFGLNPLQSVWREVSRNIKSLDE